MPGPSHDTEDAILKARQATLNTAPFTAEHLAAYAAFAGVTDRNTALKLHRHHVTWDDVNDYPRTNILGSCDYATMTRLAQAHVTPALLTTWANALTKFSPHTPGNLNSLGTSPSRVEEVVAYVSGGVNPVQVRAFFDTPHRWATQNIVAFIKANVSATHAAQFFEAGIMNPNNIVLLTKMGCTPQTVTERRQATPSIPVSSFERTCMRTANKLSTLVERKPLIPVALANNATVTETLEWDTHGETIHRIDLFMKAHITADEWFNDPTVREANSDTIAMLAALNGHTVDTFTAA